MRHIFRPPARDLDEAIEAHVAWKDRLSTYICGCRRDIDPFDVSSDRKCDLGRWIHGRGRLYCWLPEFRELKEVHARFHLAAASIVARVNAGHDVSVKDSLEEGSLYQEASKNVIGALLRMKHCV